MVAEKEKNGKGRKPGQIPKYTIGILYAVAYRNLKKTPEQIAKYTRDVPIHADNHFHYEEDVLAVPVADPRQLALNLGG